MLGQRRMKPALVLRHVFTCVTTSISYLFVTALGGMICLNAVLANLSKP